MLSPFPQYAGTGCVGMVQRCTKKGLGRSSGSISLPTGWSDTRRRSLEGRVNAPGLSVFKGCGQCL